MNENYVIIGIILMVVGFFTSFLCFGWILLPVGLVLFIVGLVTDNKPQQVIVYNQSPPPAQPPAAYPAQTQQPSSKFCQSCGSQSLGSAQYCSQCGKPL